jgi:hypothetical protein
MQGPGVCPVWPVRPVLDPTGSNGRIIMTSQARFVGGIDSHKDTIPDAVITELGLAVEDREFPTTITGYRDATLLAARLQNAASPRGAS